MRHFDQSWQAVGGPRRRPRDQARRDHRRRRVRVRLLPQGAPELHRRGWRRRRDGRATCRSCSPRATTRRCRRSPTELGLAGAVVADGGARERARTGSTATSSACSRASPTAPAADRTEASWRGPAPAPAGWWPGSRRAAAGPRRRPTDRSGGCARPAARPGCWWGRDPHRTRSRGTPGELTAGQQSQLRRHHRSVAWGCDSHFRTSAVRCPEWTCSWQRRRPTPSSEASVTRGGHITDRGARSRRVDGAGRRRRRRRGRGEVREPSRGRSVPRAWLGISDVASSCSVSVRPPGSRSRAARRGGASPVTATVTPASRSTRCTPARSASPVTARIRAGPRASTSCRRSSTSSSTCRRTTRTTRTSGRSGAATASRCVTACRTNSCVDVEGRVVPVHARAGHVPAGPRRVAELGVDAPPDRRRPHGRLPVRRQLQRDALLGRHRPPLLLVAREHVPAVRPLVRVGARADVPEPHVPAGRHVPGPDRHRHQPKVAADAAPGRRHHLGQAQRVRHLVARLRVRPARHRCCSRRRIAANVDKVKTFPQFLADCARGHAAVGVDREPGRRRRTPRRTRPTSSSARRTARRSINAVMHRPGVAEDRAALHVRRARRLLRPRARRRPRSRPTTSRPRSRRRPARPRRGTATACACRRS